MIRKKVLLTNCRLIFFVYCVTLNFKNDRSAEAIVTGAVSNIFKAIITFGSILEVFIDYTFWCVAACTVLWYNTS